MLGYNQKTNVMDIVLIWKRHIEIGTVRQDMLLQLLMHMHMCCISNTVKDVVHGTCCNCQLAQHAEHAAVLCPFRSCTIP